MKALSRNELALLLVWAFREQQVESAANPHLDALTLYCNVMALPVAEAATVVSYARRGDVPPTEPVALALDQERTLAMWATRRGFGAALAGPDGAFRKVAAPTGPPPEIYHSNSTNRDTRSAGAYAIVAWARGHTVRVSVRRF